MKILNLYAGIGGNRKWGNQHEITAVENDPAVAGLTDKQLTIFLGDLFGVGRLN